MHLRGRFAWNISRYRVRKTEHFKRTLGMSIFYYVSIQKVRWGAASKTKGPRFESSHRKFYNEHLFTISNIYVAIEKMKIKKKSTNSSFRASQNTLFKVLSPFSLSLSLSPSLSLSCVSSYCSKRHRYDCTGIWFPTILDFTRPGKIKFFDWLSFRYHDDLIAYLDPSLGISVTR